MGGGERRQWVGAVRDKRREEGTEMERRTLEKDRVTGKGREKGWGGEGGRRK